MARYARQFTAEERRVGAAKRLGITVTEYNAHIAAGEKWCWRCRNWHPRHEFRRNASNPDGLTTMCADCCRSYQRETYRMTTVAWRAERKPVRR